MAKLVVQSVNALVRGEILASIKVINILKKIFGHISRDQNFLLLSSKLTQKEEKPHNKKTHHFDPFGVLIL